MGYSSAMYLDRTEQFGFRHGLPGSGVEVWDIQRALEGENCFPANETLSTRLYIAT